MTTRSTRLVAYLVSLLVLGSGVSLASSGPAIVADGIHVVSLKMTTPFSHAGRITQTRPEERVQLSAGGNPAVCKANYDQCIKGCDGMASCNNQCAANYRGCLGQ